MPEKGATRHVSGQIDLNRASEQELARVSDIGNSRAHKIIEYRAQHGDFRSVDDLKNVEGFDRKLTDDLRESLKV